MKITDLLRQYMVPAVIGIAPAVGAYIWVESHFDEMNDKVDSMELHVVKLLDRNLAQTKEAIDRNEEWLSREHQQHLASVAQMLVSIGHDLGYSERLAHENDHGHKE